MVLLWNTQIYLEISAAKSFAKKLGLKQHKIIDIGFMKELYGDSNVLTRKKKIDILKRNKFHLIKIKLDKNKNLDLKLILQKLYKNGCRNLLVEGGNRLTNSFLKGRLFHKFYLIDIFFFA